MSDARTRKTIFVLEDRRKRRRLAELSASELRGRADRFRAMAATATTRQTMEALTRLGKRLDALAERRANEEAGKA